MSSFPSAEWRISLECECPSCQEYVDLTRLSGFWDSSPTTTPVQAGDTGAFPVVCPLCWHRFTCEMEYT